MRTYEESLKVYRDNKNAMDYAIKTAREEAWQEAMVKIAKEMKSEGDSIEKIARVTGLAPEQIEKL